MSLPSKLISNVEQAVIGKPDVVRLAVACLLAEGHLLIDDIPGVGKTTLAVALAKSIGGTFQRIQFTSDLLPSDVLGVSIFNPKDQEFHFKRGPIFHHVVLADEVNRASPKTQSALLESMQERQVSMDGQTIRLPAPFFVIATQNPHDQYGTFPLPESQLDRFLMRLNLGYPNAQAEMEILKSDAVHARTESLSAVSNAENVAAEIEKTRRVKVDDSIDVYII
jgi:MoxR-like ATPase